MRLLILNALLCVTSAASAGEGSLFENLSYQDALTKAKKENKVVLIDFYTTWCGPCKLLDRTTFQNSEVISWLRERTVPIKIDAEVDVALAGKFKVLVYPTLIYVKADGTVLDALMGYRDSKAFLKDSETVLSGKDPLSDEKKELIEKKEGDPNVRLRYARILVKEGEHARALEEFLWCYDKGHLEKPAFLAIRGSFLLSDLIQLGSAYPPALEALENRRDALAKKLAGGQADRSAALDFANLNRTMGQSEKTLALFDSLSKDDRLRQVLAKSVFPLLLKEKRYIHIQETNNLAAEVEGVFEKHERLQERMKQTGRRLPSKEVVRLKARAAVGRASEYYQIYLGLKKVTQAAILAQRILAIDQGAETYNDLAWNAYLSGQANDTNLEQARMAHQLSMGKSGEIINSYARLLYQRDRKDEAIALVREAKTRFPTRSRETTALEECLAFLEGDK